MLTTSRSASLSSLETAVLECVAYSDLFDYPLRPDEIHRWLSIPATLAEVVATLEDAAMSPMLERVGPFVTLAGRAEIAGVRERRQASSAALRETAERYGRLIARLPFVRMVAITGSLAVDNADAGDDLDYLIVTAPGRVWTVRSMVMAIGRMASLRGVTLCPNYLLSESALALPDRDFYTARELLQMQPIAGHATYARMLEANTWWQDYLPNARPSSPTPSPAAAGGRLNGTLEAFLHLPAYDALEDWILARKGPELRRDAGGPEAVFDATMCKGHHDAWRTRTQHRLEARMQQLLETMP